MRRAALPDWLHAVLFAAVALVSPDSYAANHAILIGVSSYPSLDADFQLEGPRNDVPLMRDVLVQKGFGPDSIRTLADGVDGAALPTHDAIVNAFAAVANQTKPGDSIFVYIAGHGSQQPAPEGDGDELDGYDELFLPIDAGKWDGDKHAVANSISDNDFNALLSGLTDRGAFVFVVFDTCHAGTSIRAGRERYRSVPPSILRIPERVRSSTHARTPARSFGGRLVALYASRSDELTPELKLPADDAHASVHGLLTWNLAELLRLSDDSTYRQLLDDLLLRYRMTSRVFPTPTFEGVGLDRVVFKSESKPIREWLVERRGEQVVLLGGLLDGVTTGSTLDILDSSIRPGKSLGRARVEFAGLASSVLVSENAASDQAGDLGKQLVNRDRIGRLVTAAKRNALMDALNQNRQSSVLDVSLLTQAQTLSPASGFASPGPELCVGSRITLALTNRNGFPMDVTVLHSGPDGTLDTIYPTDPDVANTVPARSRTVKMRFTLTGQPVGREALLIWAARAAALTPVADARLLVTDGVRAPPTSANAIETEYRNKESIPSSRLIEEGAASLTVYPWVSAQCKIKQ